MISYKSAKARHIKLGLRGEALAVSYLTRKRIEVLTRNHRNKRGEIDVIARDGEVVCFIEVKTRRATTRSRPSEGLSERQRKRICAAADVYLWSIGRPRVVYRFDLIEVVLDGWDVRELRYWRNHWSCG